MAEKKSLFTNVADDGISEASYTLTGSRWSYGYQIFKENFTKVFLLNLIMLVMSAPILFLLYLRFAQLTTAVSNSPFSANIGLGYFPYSSLVGLEQNIMLIVNRECFMYMPLAAILFGVGLAGGLYVVRKMFWGEKVSLLKDFWFGIKRNWLNIVIFSVIFAIILGLCIFGISFSEYYMATQSHHWTIVFSEVVLYIALFFVTMLYLAAITMTVSYKVKFFGLIKNAFLMTVILLPLNAFFAAFSLVPFILCGFDGIVRTLGFAICLFFGFSFFLIVWTDYSHWIYDKFINPTLLKNLPKNQLQSNKKQGATQQTPKATATVAAPKLALKKIKPVNDEEVKIDVIPVYFSLDDIEKLDKSKEVAKTDAENFEKAQTETVNLTSTKTADDTENGKKQTQQKDKNKSNKE